MNAVRSLCRGLGQWYLSLSAPWLNIRMHFIPRLLPFRSMTASLRLSRRHWLSTAICGIAFVLPAVHAQSSDSWPSKPVRIIVPFAAGGSTDAVGRMLAVELGKELGQPVIVENKGGANGNIGSDSAAKSAPDGYTLLLSGIGSNAINYSMYRRIPYSDASFSHIALLAKGPAVLVVNDAFPARNLQEFVREVKAHPEKYAYASAGSGSSGHVTMELLQQALGLEMVHIPYKGNGPAISDVIAGQVPMVMLNNDVALPQVKAGKVRALAVTSKTRNPAYPDVPTVSETGVADIDVVSWFGLSAPARTPAPVIQRLSEATNRALQAPKLREHLESVGFVVGGGNSAEFSRFVANEISQWKAVVERSGATAD